MTTGNVDDPSRSGNSAAGNSNRDSNNNTNGLARALWLIDRLGGDPSTGKCLCPAHDDQNPSLHVALNKFTSRGDPVFTCRVCEQDALIAALKARADWPIPRGRLPAPRGGTPQTVRTPEERRDYAKRIWDDLKQQAWDIELAGDYFRGRGLNTVPATACISLSRSEERRVGKECRSRWSPYH